MGESCLNFGVLGIGASKQDLALGKFELINFVVEGIAGGIEGDGSKTGAPGGVI